MKLKLLLTALLALLAPFGNQLSAANKPNIIFILFDDLGYGEPRSFRTDSPFKMPNLDKLASEGMRFTDAHSASSVCTPTRYGVLTGRYPWRLGQYGVLKHQSPPIIPAQRLTVAGMLKANGYHTGCFGKWHLGMNIKETSVANGPITRGFDQFFGYTEAASSAILIEQDKVVANVARVESAPLIEQKTLAYIDERAKAGQPFFLYIPLSQPHGPHVPIPEFQGKTDQKEYGDWMMQGDATVGKILAALERHQISSNTLVIVTSDNGAQEHVYLPLRGCKSEIWEGGHRVPLYASWPETIKPGSTCNDTICHNDLFATCADIVGAKLPANAAEDSFSILPNLLGTATGPVREATVHQAARREHAIRQGPWKLVFLTNGTKELYNLQNDLGETKNRAAAQPEVVARLTVLMQRYINTGRSTPGAAQKNDVAVSLKGGRKKGRSEPE